MSVEHAAPAVVVGVSVPQANPTVEWELRTLLPKEALAVVTRATSPSLVAEERLVSYLENLRSQMRSFDTLALGALGLACTGSSYLVGRDRESVVLREVTKEAGYPVITATEAIAEELALLGCRRLALLAPYPDSLAAAAADYWGARGFELVAQASGFAGSADTREIYKLTPKAICSAFAAFDSDTADVVLLSGTGMPTLGALSLTETERLFARPGQVVVSSNLCLAASLLRAAGYLSPDRAARSLLPETVG